MKDHELKSLTSQSKNSKKVITEITRLQEVMLQVYFVSILSLSKNDVIIKIIIGLAINYY